MNRDINQLKKDNFKVPEGYFENISDKILDRWKESDKSEVNTIGQQSPGRVIKMNYSRRYWITGLVAAAIALLVYWNLPGKNSDRFDPTSLNNEEIMAFLNQNSDQIDLELLSNEVADNLEPLNFIPSDLNAIDTDALYEDLPLEDIIN